MKYSFVKQQSNILAMMINQKLNISSKGIEKLKKVVRRLVNLFYFQSKIQFNSVCFAYD